MTDTTGVRYVTLQKTDMRKRHPSYYSKSSLHFVDLEAFALSLTYQFMVSVYAHIVISTEGRNLKCP